MGPVGPAEQNAHFAMIVLWSHLRVKYFAQQQSSATGGFAGAGRSLRSALLLKGTYHTQFDSDPIRVTHRLF
jgi:hypothetical protein